MTSQENGTFTVKGFFLTDPLPALTAGDGTTIHGDVAAQFAGSIAPGQYAGQAGALGAPIGQVRSLSAAGTVTVTHSDGTPAVLKVGDPLYLDDSIETSVGANVGITLIDGTSLALDQSGELVLDELVYNPADKSGKATISLVSGAAQFISGTIAKSGQDNMTFKTLVGTVGIRGTKVYVDFNPTTGDVTILNRPTGTDAQGNDTASTIALFSLDGTPSARSQAVKPAGGSTRPPASLSPLRSLIGPL